MPDWLRKFSKPLHPKDSKPIATLAEARAYVLKLDPGFAQKKEWQRVAETLVAAAEGGSMGIAHEALFNALFINTRLAPFESK